MGVELLPKTGTFADWMVVEATRIEATIISIPLDLNVGYAHALPDSCNSMTGDRLVSAKT